MKLRRPLVFLLLIFGLLTIFFGIAEAQSWHARPAVAHIVVASLFILTCITHLVVNRKAVLRYIKGK